MANLLVATAGHIDHGKTALIQALNGFNGDSTKEEKERAITIDLSFSNLKNGEQNISFIDVPGHENLLKTMISGAFSIDVGLVVIAGDDGLMPQSIEHIKVLNYLGINSLILAITKCDLISHERALFVLKSAQEFLKNYENLNILKSFFISIKDEKSIKDLKNYLFTLKAKERDINGVLRYYVDRAFILKGIGVIATGSIISGTLKKGEKLFNYDKQKELSIKSLQTHGVLVQSACACERLALNLSGCELKDITKGDFISKKGYFRAFKELDCVVFGQIRHNENLLFCIGTKQVNAKILVLNASCDETKPKPKDKENKFYATIKLENAVFASFNEPFILLSLGRVRAGGRVLNPISEPLKKSVKTELLQALENKNFLKAFGILKSAHKNGFGLISSEQRFNLSHENALNIAKKLDNALIDENALNVYDISAKEHIKAYIKFLLQKNEFAIFSATSIALKLPWASAFLAQLCIDEMSEFLSKNDGVYTKKGVDFSKLKKRVEDEILSILDKQALMPQAPYNIYDYLEIDRTSGDNALKKLCAKKIVIRLAHNLFISAKHLNNALEKLKELIKKDGFVNINTAKKALNLSRKYTIAYLEALDKDENITKNGTDRVFKI